MKVIHINISDTDGGASIAAYRHFEAMRNAGIDASMLVINKKKRANPHIFSICSNKYSKIKYFIRSNLINILVKSFKPWGTYSFPLYSFSRSIHPAIKDADIIYLHWVAASMFSIKEVEKILKLGKPVRWYMHDMNPITGGCHYSMECEQYKTGCIKCPHLKRHPFGIDLSHIQFIKRMRSWSKYSNLEAYTPSMWLGKCVGESILWKGHKITIFPNVIDTKKFRPLDKEIARNILNISTSKKIILFGAVGISSPYKGWEYICRALNSLDSNLYEAVVFGEENIDIRRKLKIDCNFLGFLHDEYSLILAYNVADVFVSSSLADNYPNVILEAMACGLPCVGFNIGGIPNQIKHKYNGYLAHPKDFKSLAEGVKYICSIPEIEYKSISEAARKFVCENASYDVYKYIDLLNNHSNSPEIPMK